MLLTFAKILNFDVFSTISRFWQFLEKYQIKSFIILPTIQLLCKIRCNKMQYAEACNELALPISASLHLGNATSFEEMSQRWRAVGNKWTFEEMCSIWPARDLNLRCLSPETNALPFDQLAGWEALCGWALIAKGQPTVECIKTEPNALATKQFSCIIAPKSSLSISTHLVRKVYFGSHAVVWRFDN